MVVYMYTLMSNACIMCIVFGNNPIYGFQTNKIFLISDLKKTVVVLELIPHLQENRLLKRNLPTQRRHQNLPS